MRGPTIARARSKSARVSAENDCVSTTARFYRYNLKMATEPARTYPSELPVVALRQTVVFPLTLQPLAINRPVSIESVNRALGADRLLFLSLQLNDREEPEPSDLRPVGTIAVIRQMAKVPAGGIHVIVEGITRARAEAFTRNEL